MQVPRFVPSSFRTLSGTTGSASTAPVTAFGAVADDDFGADAAVTATVLLSFSPWFTITLRIYPLCRAVFKAG